MRKFIVKHFALNYSTKLFGTTFTALRASRIIFPVFCLAGFLTAINPNWPELTWYTTLAYLLVGIVVYFGFIYFRFYPVKWNELDEYQKFQYGIAINSNQLTKPKEYYTDIDWEEWQTLCNKFLK